MVERPLHGWPLVLAWVAMLAGSWGAIFWTAAQLRTPEPACKPPTVSEYTVTRSYMRADGQITHQCERYGDVHYTRRDTKP